MQDFTMKHQSKHSNPNLSAGLAWVLPAYGEFHPTVKTASTKESSVKRLRILRHSCSKMSLLCAFYGCRDFWTHGTQSFLTFTAIKDTILLYSSNSLLTSADSSSFWSCGSQSQIRYAWI